MYIVFRQYTFIYINRFLFYSMGYSSLLSLLVLILELSQIWSVKAHLKWFFVLQTQFHHSLSIFLLSGTSKCSMCILPFLSPSPSISHFPSPDSVQWRMVLETKVWPLVEVIASRPCQGQSQEIYECRCVHTHISSLAIYHLSIYQSIYYLSIYLPMLKNPKFILIRSSIV